MRISRLAVLFMGVLLLSSSLFAEGVLIRCERPCDAAKAAVTNVGGEVTIEYRYINAIAAEVPDKGYSVLSLALPAGSVTRDPIEYLPEAATGKDGKAEALSASISADAVELLTPEAIAAGAETSPDGWSLNNTFINVAPLFSAGYTGAGIRVAVIDSGLRPSFLGNAGGVIGGENFVPTGSYLSPANGTHGTFVAGMIGNRTVLGLGGLPAWVSAITTHCGAPCITGTTVPMVGSAPGSGIYALRVFAATGGAPRSRVLAAGERVIELRENFDNGMAETIDSDGRAEALNIQVCNMSLGGATMNAGGDLYNELAQAMLDRDIVLVTSAGNSGPSGSTGGTPGTSLEALTVGAASTAMHERILRHITNGAAVAFAYRPTTHTQTAYFSSRGPTADGRFSPHVTANGFASFSSNQLGSLSIGSGTSFSAPTVAGVAAVLRQAHPTATARQIRNAIIMSADPNYLGDGSGPNDQGFGFVDAAAASALLAGSSVPETLPAEGINNRSVNVNIVRGVGIKAESGTVVKTATLLPGERLETYYRVNPNTAAVVVTLSDVTPGDVQNVLFGDDIFFFVHSAKTSAHGGSGDYKVTAFTTGGSWVIPNPETGLMRVTATGDWTNASPITATVTISSLSQSVPGNLSQGKIIEGDLVEVPFVVPAGTAQLTAVLEWAGDWGAYPTNDVDLYLFRPNQTVVNSGATGNSPERVIINNPPAGTWTALIHGFEVNSSDERYKLVVLVDGKPAKK
jgi:serine protease AprX